MRIQVVHARPLEDSDNAALHERGREVVATDLYREGFQPAMMKGWVDRVWGPGIAFEHDRDGGRIKPLLQHIRLFGVVTSYGAPWWVVRLYAGDPGRKVLMRGMKPLCRPRAESFYLAHYDIGRSTPATRAAFLDRVAARVMSIAP